MHLFHIPQHTIPSINMHISVLNDALWDMEQVHYGVCKLGQLNTTWGINFENTDVFIREVTFWICQRMTWSPLLGPQFGYLGDIGKSLQLKWRSGTRRWNLRVSDLQLSCSDIARLRGYQYRSPSNDHQTKCLISWISQYITTNLLAMWLRMLYVKAMTICTKSPSSTSSLFATRSHRAYIWRGGRKQQVIHHNDVMTWKCFPPLWEESADYQWILPRIGSIIWRFWYDLCC